MISRLRYLVPFIVLVGMGRATSCPGWKHSSVISSQPLAGDLFVGCPVKAHELPPKQAIQPASHSVHADGGNTRSENRKGPLGKDVRVDSWRIPSLAPILWHDDGRLTAALICSQAKACIVAFDPQTFDVLATFPKPGDGVVLSMISMIYLQTLDDHITTPTANGHILDLQRIDQYNQTTFIKRRDIDLSKVVYRNSTIIASACDGSGNIWFMTGGYSNFGTRSSGIATIGYIEAGGRVWSMKLKDSLIENGFAISGTTVYLVTGPAGPADVSNATGLLYAFQPSSCGVRVVLTQTYDAGSSKKKGGIARGSGSTPTLLGNEYIAFTDNADSQINVNIVRQVTNTRKAQKIICKVPIFEPGASANENALVGYWDGNSTYSVVVANYFNAPDLKQLIYPAFGDGSLLNASIVNGPFNKINQTAPGLVRVDLNAETERCTIRWYNRDIRALTAAVLSTQTGLLYMSVQDYQLALQGKYVYYFVAVDFTTGREVWRVRQGAGGSYFSFQGPVLTPDDGVGQYVLGGFVKAEDS